MIKTPRRLVRLFCCLLIFGSVAQAADPAKTVIQDTIYRADGSLAAGTLVISWPAFVTGDGKPVAAGTKIVRIGPDGHVSIPLVPTQGATPAGTYYKVVLNLSEIKTNMHWLLGDGKPGIIQELAERVERHEQVLQRLKGMMGVIAGLLTFVHLAIDYFRAQR